MNFGYKKIIFNFQLVTDFVTTPNELFQNLEKDNRIGIAPQIYISENFIEFQTMKLDIIYSDGFLIKRQNPWRKILNKQ